MRNRQSIRMDGYDYSESGYYFVTVDVWTKRNMFGEIIDGKMNLNKYGLILNDEILNTPKIRIGVKIHTFQIMPDHWHVIIFIPDVGARCFAPFGNIQARENDMYVDRADGNPPIHKKNIQNLGNIVGGIKMAVSKKIKIDGFKFRLWQRNYYERIIRNEFELNRVRKYILENPIKWKK